MHVHQTTRRNWLAAWHLQEVLERIALSIDPQQARGFPVHVAGRTTVNHGSGCSQAHCQDGTRADRKEAASCQLVACNQIQVATAVFNTSNGSVEFLNEKPTLSIK